MLFLLLMGIANPKATNTPTTSIDLNTAPPALLMQLPGIGERRALEIVAARKARPFRRVGDLLRVKGIGKKTLEKLRPWVRVETKPSIRYFHIQKLD